MNRRIPENKLCLFTFFAILGGVLGVLSNGSSVWGIEAESGSSTDIQAAVNQIADAGGTVYIPAGNYDFDSTVNIPGGVNIIGDGPDNTVLIGRGTLSINNPHGGFPIKSDRTRVSGINFKNTGTAVSIISVVDFRIDNCIFDGRPNRGGYIVNIGYRYTYSKPRGVIDHCSFYDVDYGVHIGPQLWDPPEERGIKYTGTVDTVFIEDCHFEDVGHVGASFSGSHYVVRHSTIVRSTIDAHGPGYEYIWDWKGDRGGGNFQFRAGRCVEIYENAFAGPGWTGIKPRGGSGFIFNNVISNLSHAVILEMEAGSYNATNGTYPALDQPHDFWIWNNMLENVGDNVYIYSSYPDFVQQDRDYFLREPTMELDGFVYRPYTYPHPLVTGHGEASKPVAPSQLRMAQ